MTFKRKERIILITQFHMRNPLKKKSKYGEYITTVSFHTLKTLQVKDDEWMWQICCQRCQVGFRIWPETCLQFHRPALPAEHRVVLLVARSASGSVFYTLNSCMQRRNFWKANSSSANQEFSRILWNRKVHRRFHNSIPPVTILSQINAVHFPNRFPLFEFNIILPSMPRSSSRYFHSGFPTKPYIPLSIIHATCNAHIPWNFSLFSIL